MNNKSFISELSQRTGYTQDDVQKMVNTIIDSMNDSFQRGDIVAIPKFGTFEVKKRLERIVVNPGTKQRMLVPPKACIEFQTYRVDKRKIKKWRIGLMAKISIQDMAKAIAGKHGLAQRDAEAFVSALFDVINDGLHTEKSCQGKRFGHV